MPETRSKARGDAPKSEFQPRSAKGKAPASAGSKRKAPDSSTKSTPAKKSKSKKEAKQAKIEPETGHVDKSAAEQEQQEEDDDETISINRAPVLELWSSCVTQLLHPSIPWSTCLSVGGAIATITAISKGRSIGAIDKPDEEAQQEKQEKRKEEQAELDEVTVMNFHLKLKDGNAIVGNKPKKPNEEALKKKYGEEQYEKVKKTMQDALRAWKDKEDELDSRAFHMYEDLRPNVAAGQKGWGRKGGLSLKTIRNAVSAT